MGAICYNKPIILYQKNVEMYIKTEGSVEMKKMLLSMKPHWRDKIMSGEKIYEYRTRFADEAVIAILYVSKPVYAVTGVLYLGKKINLQDWKDLYREDPELVDRIKAYESRGNKVAMPILAYQETNEISLKELRDNVEGFVAPQSYNYIREGSELEQYLSAHLVQGIKKENDIEGRGIDEICRNYH